MDLEKEIFEGKKLADLIKEVYEKHREQDSSIGREITRLSELISSPGDAIIIVPLLKGFFDSSLKNDEVLLKIVQIFQKASEKTTQNNDETSLISEKELQQLFSEIDTVSKLEPKKLNN